MGPSHQLLRRHGKHAEEDQSVPVQGVCLRRRYGDVRSEEQVLEVMMFTSHFVPITYRWNIHCRVFLGIALIPLHFFVAYVFSLGDSFSFQESVTNFSIFFAPVIASTLPCLWFEPLCHLKVQITQETITFLLGKKAIRTYPTEAIRHIGSTYLNGFFCFYNEKSSLYNEMIYFCLSAESIPTQILLTKLIDKRAGFAIPMTPEASSCLYQFFSPSVLGSLEKDRH